MGTVDGGHTKEKNSAKTDVAAMAASLKVWLQSDDFSHMLNKDSVLGTELFACICLLLIWSSYGIMVLSGKQ